MLGALAKPDKTNESIRAINDLYGSIHDAMDLKKLSQFLAIVDAGSMSRAAVRLHIAQPALTHSVKSLEAELGVRLLERHARGVVLTEFGELLAEHARSIIRDVERASAIIRDRVNRPSGSVRIVIPHLLSGCLSPALLHALPHRLPDVGLTVLERDAEAAHEAVQSAAADLALTYASEVTGDVTLQPLVVERLALVTRADRAPLAPSVPLSVAAQQDLLLLPTTHPVRRSIDSVAQRGGVRLRAVAELESVADLMISVDNGMATILPRFPVARHLKPNVTVTPLLESSLDCCLFLMTPRNRPTSRILTAFQLILLETIEGFVRSDLWHGRYVGHLPSDASMVTIFSNID